jgi:hypothetical protein
MKNQARFVALCLLASGAFGCSRATSAADGKPLRVLFIGNSYTYVNDLPGMLTELSRARAGQVIETGQDTPGAYTLQQHAEDGKAAAAIGGQQWDYVVLQEQSQVPFMSPATMADGATKLDACIRSDHARTLFYLTWARLAQPEKQSAINRAYFDCAEKLHARVAPVGAAWQRVRKAKPELSLYADDGSHPSPAGTYLAACVFYAALLDKSPEGLPAKVSHEGNVLADLDAADARLLQATAWRTVQEVKSESAAK